MCVCRSVCSQEGWREEGACAPVLAAALMCPNLLCWAQTAQLCRAAPLRCSVQRHSPSRS